MKFNPFETTYNDNIEQHLSLLDKILDTFNVFSGEYMERFGLFDYFTLGLFYLNSLIFASIRNQISDYNLIALFLFMPAIILSALVILASFPLRYLVSGTFTLISIPFVVLVHVLSIQAKHAEIKQTIADSIQESIDTNNNSLTIKISANLNVWIKTVIEQLIDQLNHNPTITELTITKDEPLTNSLKQLILKLKYITKLSAPNDNFDNASAAALPQSNIMQLGTAGITNIITLYTFLAENTKLDSLKFRLFAQVENIEGREEVLLEQFNQSVLENGIQYPCQILPPRKLELFDQINLTMDEVRESYLALGACFEFCKIWCTGDNKNSLDGNRDILQYIMMMFIKMCPKDIVEKNKNGFIKTMKSNGFFYQPSSSPSPKLIGSDAQNQSNDTVIAIHNDI